MARGVNHFRLGSGELLARAAFTNHYYKGPNVLKTLCGPLKIKVLMVVGATISFSILPFSTEVVIYYLYQQLQH